LKYRKAPGIVAQRVYLVFYWLIGLAAPAVLLPGIIKSYPFPDRYSCQVNPLLLLLPNFSISIVSLRRGRCGFLFYARSIHSTDIIYISVPVTPAPH
jgi:hypothetical protein